MNNQIQELANQAKASVPQGLSVDKWIETYNKKFAELIVQECYKVVVKNPHLSTSLAGRNMKEYFGVE